MFSFISPYDKALKKTDLSYITRLKRILTVGGLSALMYLIATIFDFILLFLLTIFQPLKKIKRNNKEFKYKNYKKYLESKSYENNKKVKKKKQ